MWFAYKDINLIVTKNYVPTKNISLPQVNLFFQHEIKEIFFTNNKKNYIYFTEMYIWLS